MEENNTPARGTQNWVENHSVVEKKYFVFEEKMYLKGRFLMRKPFLQDKRQERKNCQKYGVELLKQVSGRIKSNREGRRGDGQIGQGWEGG
ncbi:hypothetical protein OUZ56_029730 [Daphnia magna]|uniref:Uncharacterized protein n=1 Tax=Daphnia magna TaxID=35525 RepID=A0ABR0B7N7_9CRUS|nr:hypothetical protein OUZ56_029730 [Daphnia magna]